MKYLKLYEYYSTNEFWSQINLTEWDKLMDSNIVNFTDKELEEIRQLAIELSPDTTEYIDGKLYPFGWNVKRVDSYIYSPYYNQILYVQLYIHNILFVTISKLEDEWFGIAESWHDGRDIFYKCDQWLGLIEALKYIFKNA